MKKTVSLLMLGENKVGLINDVTKIIYKTGSSILKSNMKKIDNNFILSLKAETPINIDLNNLNYGNVTVIDNNDYIKYRKINQKFIKNVNINISLSDSPGIIHKTTNELRKYNLDILELNSYIVSAPHSLCPLFNLSVNLNIYSEEDISYIKNKLKEKLFNEYGADVHIV